MGGGPPPKNHRGLSTPPISRLSNAFLFWLKTEYRTWIDISAKMCLDFFITDFWFSGCSEHDDPSFGDIFHVRIWKSKHRRVQSNRKTRNLLWKKSKQILAERSIHVRYLVFNQNKNALLSLEIGGADKARRFGGVPLPFLRDPHIECRTSFWHSYVRWCLEGLKIDAR